MAERCAQSNTNQPVTPLLVKGHTSEEGLRPKFGRFGRVIRLLIVCGVLFHQGRTLHHQEDGSQTSQPNAKDDDHGMTSTPLSRHFLFKEW
jgi:hypothetical protein